MEKYAPRITGQEPIAPFINLYEDNPIGYIQTYKIKDYPEYSRCVQMEDDAAGMDLFIGHPEYIHRGLGSHTMAKFLPEIVFGTSDAVSCIVGPELKNKGAIRAYEKVGFRYVKTAYRFCKSIINLTCSLFLA